MAVVRGDSNAVLKDLTIIAEDTVAQTRPELYPLICSTRSEEGSYTRIPVPANMPFPRKLEGERSKMGKDVNVRAEYVQDTYELTIELDSDLVRNAKAYEFADLVREATIAAKLFPDYLTSQAVINGGTNKAYDGQTFYGTTHTFAKTGANNINNTVSATGQTVTQIAADLGTALASIRTFQDNAGRLLNPLAKQGTSRLVAHFPAALEQAFTQVLNGSWFPTTAPVTGGAGTAAVPTGFNSLQGIATPFCDGYLDPISPTRWYLHFVGMPQRPFVYLENYGLQVSVLGFGSEYEVMNNKVVIALKQRFVIGNYRFDRSMKIG